MHAFKKKLVLIGLVWLHLSLLLQEDHKHTSHVEHSIYTLSTELVSEWLICIADCIDGHEQKCNMQSGFQQRDNSNMMWQFSQQER